MRKVQALIFAVALGGFAGVAGAQNTPAAPAAKPAPVAKAPRAATLDELLAKVKQGLLTETAEYRKREAEFRSALNRQAQLLRKAKATKAAEERRSDRLENEFQQNETKLAELQAVLTKRLGTLGELFGVVRQVAGDTRGQLESSIISAEYPDRGKFLGKLAQKKELPQIEELERLWYEILREITETGKVVKYPATIITLAGDQVQKQVVRVGAFNSVADGKYLQYLPKSGKLAELARQPQRRYLNWAKDLEKATSGFVDFGIDPSRGSILALLIEKPDLTERIKQGGLVGYVIIALGIFGVLLVVERMYVLTRESRRVSAQARDTGSPRDNNPLGRVLHVYEQYSDVDVETLELKLDEAILKEVPPLERGLSTVKVVSVVAPLLGLLGTVTGMIATFQAITLFGTGDPKLMAGGISQALVTTVLGLVVAIPTVLLHSLVAGQSGRIVHILEEQSAGLIAMHAEELEGHAGSA